MNDAARDLAIEVLNAAQRRAMLITLAESCTGGLIAGALTDIPGSSAVMDRSYVTYSNIAKTDMLGVDPTLIMEHGAVSAEVAEAMARGALCRSPAKLAVSVTGIAGPGGGSAAKPVGLVYIATADRTGTAAHRHLFEDKGRDHIRQETVLKTLRHLLARLNDL